MPLIVFFGEQGGSVFQLASPPPVVLVMDEERYFSQLENEAEKVKRFGESYLAQQAMERNMRAPNYPLS